ncbi:M23 family metallopeptidase [Mobiluncus mulieris]|uniref:M23 family metallopeptidase n=1 Tax=Mobiluncus mulieris TaxID=2052 RepID=A0A378PHF4_9ACTO|nr:M23 family metallopeptidase [Mobiluncus mulieris]MCU9968521.1 M23 family metallopeptidase [Mobiluncus mulieris]MCU9972755.1 M23 family metallopeptidase [Mobiluncus mulieris]MCV0008976.1 M23 family metallopeptidase [Mobiluncus mulieris]NMW74854.1 M23 family metallopeptidase [Mobiluncus mulieris]NMX02596.1 M23 family metallopeptidase [Mobiluncus mulieris]
MDSEKPRSRRELRERERQQRHSWFKLAFGGEKKLHHGVLRAALLGLVASVTVVAPLTGLVSPDLSTAVPSKIFNTGETLLSLVAASEEVTLYDSDLNAVPASSRIRLKEAQQLGGCVSKEDSANGDVKAAATKETLVWPMFQGSYTYTSPWGMRIHPITGERMMHEGADWAAPSGTNIYAVADGEVVNAGIQGSTGIITIKHHLNGVVFYSRYLHMYSNGIYVAKGDMVKAGDLIAGVGSTGRSTGPHLHFEIRNSRMESIEPLSFMEKHGAVYLNQRCD